MDRQELLEKVKHQVEFYFSDSNFPRDKFLRAQAATNEEGYVPLETIASFSRMKALTSDVDLIRTAVADSTEVELSEDKSMIKRVMPLPEDDQSGPRSIYAKGFPNLTGYTIEDVEKTFAPFGKVLCVRIRKVPKSKLLKPSVFVEFSTEEEAQAAAKANVKYGEKDLIVMMRSEYFQKKKEEKKKHEQEKKSSGRSKRKPDENKSEDGESNNSEQPKKRQKEEDDSEKEVKISGAILRFEKIGENMNLKSVRAIFEECGSVAFVDFKDGATEGYVRFSDEASCKSALSKFESDNKTIGDKKPELTILEEQKEKDYWLKTREERSNKKKKGRGKGRRRF